MMQGVRGTIRHPVRNELGNRVDFTFEWISDDEFEPGWVKVTAVGPNSTVEHLWTQREARVIAEELRNGNRGDFR